PPLAKPKAAAGSSTSERSATRLAQRFERSSHGLFLRAKHLALEHARSDRQQHAVAQKPQYGEAGDAGEHQIEPHPFLAVGDDRTKPFEPISSAANSTTKACASPMRMPPNNCGAAAGMTTRKKIVRAGAPILRAAQMRSLSTDSTA